VKRREFVGFGACSTLLPSISIAQSKRVPRVVLVGITRIGSQHLFAAFEQGLRERGYALGRDIVFEVRSADGNAARYPEVVNEVVRSRPDVILSSINVNTLPVKAATQSIPIVIVAGTEVVASGLVQSLARPGGNITGLTWDVGPESAAKRVELLKEIAPKMSRLGVLWEAPYGAEYLKTTEEAASALGLRTTALEFSGDLERDFSELQRNRADAVNLHHGGELFIRRAELAAVALRHRLPTACGSAEVVDAGALMSYGPNLSDLFRRAANYVDKILKGAKPADLPVERPTKLELVINRRTAKALGIGLPQSLLVRTDRFVD
jgi:putative ABC transport system substrate-binding protein